MTTGRQTTPRVVDEGDFHPIDGSDDHNGDLCDCETPEVHKVGREASALDGAMHSVWLHGKWRWLTRNMTTEQKEAAWDAVKRYSAHLAPDEPLTDDWCWWRESPPARDTTPRGS